MNTANGNMQILNVPIEDIIPNRFQPRLNFDDDGLKELAASIKEHGIIQPLILRRLQDKYEIIAGERRYKAAKMAGLTSVPAVITEMDDRKSAEVAIVENVQRRDLSSIEEAKSYKALLDKGYLTQEELAKRMGISQSAIANKLRLLSLAEGVQKALMDGKISERHARSLLQLADLDEQEKWLKTVIDERLTVRELDKRLKNLNKKVEEDVPIIEVMPNINDIKEKATDIINPSNNVEVEKKDENKDIVSIEPVEQIIEQPKQEKIPNTFFNYLEGESINMNVDEGTESVVQPQVVEEVNKTPEPAPEEVEMLDFLAPTEEEVKKDMSKAITLVEALQKTLNDNGYKVTISKEDNDKELKYSIVIDKN